MSRKFWHYLVLLFIQGITAQELPVLSTTSLANPEDDLEISGNGNYAVDTADERQHYTGLWEYSQDGILFQLKIVAQDQVLNKKEYSQTGFNRFFKKN